MLLSRNDAELFFKLHRFLMHFVNERLSIVPDVASADEFSAISPKARVEVRDALLNRLDLIESFADENPANLSDDEIDLVLSWRHQVAGDFYVFRQLKNYMVFLSAEDPPTAYGVVALAEPFEDLIGPDLPRMLQTVLLPFKGKVIYDGLLHGYNISFGGGGKRGLNDRYRRAKEEVGVVTSLPIEAAVKAMKPTKRKPEKKASGASDVQRVLQAIVGLTDDFCRQHLDDEYAELCRRLGEKLSRKRPSPLLRGQPKSWACGIIRTIGIVNFLDDPTTEPYMKLTAVDKAIGVGQSTGQGKSLEIRKMLNIGQCDPNWTVPSMMEHNPLVWILEVDGFLVDARRESREFQEIAFEQGLIPYIPADREASSMVSHGDRSDCTQRDSTTSQIFQFRITLLESEPPIWRRIQVRDCTLDKLHDHIQTAMGWTDSHLHQFEIDGRTYGDPEMLDDGFMDFECVDSTVTNLHDVVPRKARQFRFLYQYDFGDDWKHEVLFEGCREAESGKRYPRCVEGERACPPEDVGGIWGYVEFLRAVADPDHELHNEMLEWNGPFDPAAFDTKKATRAMRQALAAEQPQ